ncbi:MAG: ferrous iron transport protein A [Gammaproteobacteria bacterium]|nr:ferrous iron transport protein A [Gammaproteobacteria bacterium]
MKLTDIQTLSALKVGQSATVHALHVDSGFMYRLNAMGFRIGKPLELIRIAPFNGPFHIKLGNTEVMLRQQDAANIEVLM